MVLNVTVHNYLTDTDEREIVSYLCSNPDATFYHHPLWLKVLSEESRQPFYFILCRDEKKNICGLLPLLRTRGIPLADSPLSCRRISSLPRTPFAGVLADNNDAAEKILHRLGSLEKEMPGHLIQLKSISDYRILNNGFHAVLWRYTYIKKIPGQGADLAFESKRDEKSILRALKRAREKEVFLKKGEHINELKEWYRMYLFIMRKNRIPPRSFRFFMLLWNILRPAGLLDINYACINENGRPVIINGNINYRFHNKYFGGFKAGDYQKSGYMGGDLILYNEMLSLQQEGFESYDLGEVPLNNPSMDRYKRKWGVEKAAIYHNYSGDVDTGKLEGFDSSSENGLLSAVWKRLPLPVTARIGGAVNNFL